MQKKEDRSFLYIILAIGVLAIFLFSGGINPFAVAKGNLQSPDSDVAPTLYTDTAQQPQQPEPQPFQQPPVCSNQLVTIVGGASIARAPDFGSSLDPSIRQIPGAYVAVYDNPHPTNPANIRVEGADAGGDMMFGNGDPGERSNLVLINTASSIGTSAETDGNGFIYEYGVLPSGIPLIYKSFGANHLPGDADDGQPVLITANAVPGKKSHHLAGNKVVWIDRPISGPDTVVYRDGGFDGFGVNDYIVRFTHWQSVIPNIAVVGVSKDGHIIGLGTNGIAIHYELGRNGRFDYNGGPILDDKEIPAPGGSVYSDMEMDPEGRGTILIGGPTTNPNFAVAYWDLGPDHSLQTTDDRFSMVASGGAYYDPVTANNKLAFLYAGLQGGTTLIYNDNGPDGYWGTPFPRPDDRIAFRLTGQGTSFNSMTIVSSSEQNSRTIVGFENGNGVQAWHCF